MKLNATVCSALLSVAIGVPTFAFAQGYSEKQPPSGSTSGVSGNDATGEKTILGGLAEESGTTKSGTNAAVDKTVKERSTTTQVSSGTTGVSDSGSSTGRSVGATSGTVDTGTADITGSSTTMRAPTTYDTSADRNANRGNNWGWLGLAGLAGLFGLARKPETTERRGYVNRTTSPGTT